MSLTATKLSALGIATISNINAIFNYINVIIVILINVIEFCSCISKLGLIFQEMEIFDFMMWECLTLMWMFLNIRKVEK